MANFEAIQVPIMIDELELSYGATATEMLLPPTWVKWYELTDAEINNWNDLNEVKEISNG